MELTVSTPTASLPSIFTVRPQAKRRMRDFFSSHIRNENTRRAYLEAIRQFSAFCAQHGIEDLAQVEPVHVAAFVEDQLRQCSKPTVKQRLAALRTLFHWMVVGQVGQKGGATKTTTSHPVCLGAILHKQPAAYVLTDPNRQLKEEGRPYSVLNGRQPLDGRKS